MMKALLETVEISIRESKLYEISKEMKDKIRDTVELDKPLVFEKKGYTLEEVERRPLTETERKDIQEKTGWTDKQIDKCTINEDGTVYFKCDNEHLEGQKHEPSGVEYVRKTIDINGLRVEVVVPQFDSLLDVQLPEDLLKESNSTHIKECDRQLKDAVDKGSEIGAKFTTKQLEQINDGKTPEGYTWHHDAEVGKMQLVETKLHDKTQGGAAHTGGKAIWDGGYS